jgi:hypothetical protein
MNIAIIADGEVVSTGHYKVLFPNTSFTDAGPDTAFLQENSAMQVNLFKAYDALTQCLQDCDAYIEDGWVYTVTVRDLTAQEIQAHKDNALMQLRSERNQRLAASDWTQLADASQETKAAWSGYRQELRDLPSTVVDPRGFSGWPTPPTA